MWEKLQVFHCFSSWWTGWSDSEAFEIRNWRDALESVRMTVFCGFNSAMQATAFWSAEVPAEYATGMGIVRGNADFSGNKKKSAEKCLPVRGKNVSGGRNKVTPFLAQRFLGHVVSRLQRWQGYTTWWTVEKNLTPWLPKPVEMGVDIWRSGDKGKRKRLEGTRRKTVAQNWCEGAGLVPALWVHRVICQSGPPQPNWPLSDKEALRKGQKRRNF